MNAAGVWADDVRSLDEGADPDSIRPAKGIHITVPWSKVRNDIAVVVPVPQGQALDLRGAVGRLHLHRHHRHRLRRAARRPAVHARRHRLPAAGHQRRHDHRAHRGRHRRHLGRAPAARARRRQRAHRRPVPPPPGHAVGQSGVVTVTGGKLTTYREMAADTIDLVLDEVLGAKVIERVAKHSRTSRLPLRGAEGYAEVARPRPRPPRASTPRRDRAPGQPLRRRGPGAAGHDRARPRRWPSRSCAGLPYLRAEARLRGALRDGPQRRRHPQPPHPRPPAGPRRLGRGRRRRWPPWSPPTSAGTTPSRSARSKAYRALVDEERTAADLPETALDALGITGA